MDITIPDKAFFTIGEVGKLLNLEPYVVRYWESEFKAIKPVRTGADQRRYRKKDVELLLVIKKLLYEDGFTIAGAKKQLQQLKKDELPSHSDNSPEKSDVDRLTTIKKGLLELKDMLR